MTSSNTTISADLLAHWRTAAAAGWQFHPATVMRMLYALDAERSSLEAANAEITALQAGPYALGYDRADELAGETIRKLRADLAARDVALAEMQMALDAERAARARAEERIDAAFRYRHHNGHEYCALCQALDGERHADACEVALAHKALRAATSPECTSTNDSPV